MIKDYQKISLISQSTQDSYYGGGGSGGSQSDSDRRIRYGRFSNSSIESLSPIAQRLDYAKTNFEGAMRSEATTTLKQSSNSLKTPAVIGAALALVASIIMIVSRFESSMTNAHTNPDADSIPTSTPLCEIDRAIAFNIEKLFDPVQVNYIKSYEESAVGKYYYWDLLAEEYFRLIKEQLIKIIWMEEEVIESFFNQKFNAKESAIIRKKVWKLRDKCNDIEVSVNLNKKVIWKYKHCYCVDPEADRSKLSV